MRAFYLGWRILQRPSGKPQVRVWCKSLVVPPGEITQTLSAELAPVPVPAVQPEPAATLLDAFPLPWSHYVRLMAVRDDLARSSYEEEAIRGGWSVRQLDRQISVTPAEAIRDPYLLEFLDLKDEYAESDLEKAIVRHLENFLLELGTGFTFVARQKRIRVGDAWYKIDLLLFHRVLRCLVVIDLKLGAFTHADAGQMNLYLNYAKEHMVVAGENEPVGLILCSDKDDAVVHYAMGGINARVFASTYKTVLPDEVTLRREILATKHALDARGVNRDGS